MAIRDKMDKKLNLKKTYSTYSTSLLKCFLLLFYAVFLVLACAVDNGLEDSGVENSGSEDGGVEDTGVYRSGEYIASAESVGGPMWVVVEFTAWAIASVRVTNHGDSIDRTEVTQALETIPAAIVAAQSPEVDVISGATITSRRIMDVVNDCIVQAKIPEQVTDNG
jgi:uncharacterized protein with FMN-binding domain